MKETNNVGTSLKEKLERLLELSNDDFRQETAVRTLQLRYQKKTRRF